MRELRDAGRLAAEQQLYDDARQSGDVNLVLDGMVTAAALAIGQGQSEAASQLLAFVLYQRAIAQETRERAEQLSHELGGLPTEVQA
ncbi:MAG: hypothetical protein JXA21_01010 [Anaerolineae bacterium]|nr:hypothetical protein [Anaerolineae bacterium]